MFQRPKNPIFPVDHRHEATEDILAMFKSLVFVAAAIAPVVVRADFCKATDDVLFFSW